MRRKSVKSIYGKPVILRLDGRNVVAFDMKSGKPLMTVPEASIFDGDGYFFNDA